MASRKKTAITGGAVVLAAIVVALLLFFRKQLSWVESPPYQRSSPTTARTLVVAYSHTGNTLGAAKEIARFFDADLLRIEAPLYTRTFKGQMLASHHADERLTTTPIRHRLVDPGRYALVVLCSPTWWFRPAVPLWSFVENHDFRGRPVFLLMTGNSRYKEELIADFRDLVEERNGRYLGMHFVRRGRFYRQKSPEEVANEVREVLDAHRALWPQSAMSERRTACPSP